ncbi:unnamed protein product [Coregonus sp. 'balchen']|nr:unnamed protein product [Coregonus sp. 'balchen']
MSKIQLFKVFLNQRLTAAAEEIFGAVEQTIAEYQEECSRTKEENVRLQKLLDIVIKPEIKVHRAVNPDCFAANSIGSLVYHMKMHTKDADNSGVCEKHFDSTESMQDHLQTHIDTRFSCDVPEGVILIQYYYHRQSQTEPNQGDIAQLQSSAGPYEHSVWAQEGAAEDRTNSGRAMMED